MTQVLFFMFSILLAQAVAMTVEPIWTPLIWGSVALLFLMWVGHRPRISRVIVPFGRRRPLLSVLIVGTVGAVIVGLSWHFFARGAAVKSSPQVTSVQHAQQPFRLGLRSMAVSDAPGDLALFMVGYVSMFGETASPVSCLANLEILNDRDFEVTVDRVGLAVGDNEDGPWTDLVPIPLKGRALYMLGATPGADFQRKIEFPHGVYRFASPMKPDDLAHAALVQPNPTLEEELLKPVLPHETISGWMAFDLLPRSAKSVPNYVRISVRDTTGVSVSSISESPRRQPRDIAQDVRPGIIDKAGPVVNITGFHIRRYSDRYPQPANSKR